MTDLRHTLDALNALDLQRVRYELETLEAIRDWAMQQLHIDYRPGDRIVIVDDRPSSVGREHGWYTYREALAPGQTGTAGPIRFNTASKTWNVEVCMSRTWTVEERDTHGPNGVDRTLIRHWNGPASETPDGYQPPSPYRQEQHPDGRTVSFCMDVTYVAKAPDTPGDTPC